MRSIVVLRRYPWRWCQSSLEKHQVSTFSCASQAFRCLSWDILRHYLGPKFKCHVSSMWVLQNICHGTHPWPARSARQHCARGLLAILLLLSLLSLLLLFFLWPPVWFVLLITQSNHSLSLWHIYQVQYVLHYTQFQIPNDLFRGCLFLLGGGLLDQSWWLRLRSVVVWMKPTPPMNHWHGILSKKNTKATQVCLLLELIDNQEGMGSYQPMKGCTNLNFPRSTPGAQSKASARLGRKGCLKHKESYVSCSPCTILYSCPMLCHCRPKSFKRVMWNQSCIRRISRETVHTGLS